MSSDSILALTLATSIAASLWAVSPSEAEIQVSAYVTNQSSNNVSVIDTATNTVVGTIPVGSTPNGVAVPPDGRFA